MSSEFSNKRILITGGSDGVGLAVAEKAAADFASRVDIFDRNSPKNERLVDGDRVHFHEVDITDRSALATELAGLNGVDILFNNAGILRPGGLLDVEMEGLDDMLKVFILPQLLIIRTLIQDGKMTDLGRIIQMSSAMSLDYGYPEDAKKRLRAYRLVKRFVDAMIAELREELGEAGSGINIQTIHPGPIQTAMTGGVDATTGEVSLDYQDHMRELGWQVWHTPVEIAGEVKRLLSIPEVSSSVYDPRVKSFVLGEEED
ncbi:MAG TPA: SDR family oxidoreductase [Candidatus Gracilibacteria bacterium]